ncbi:pentatricopeptide repeat-containing protein At4g21705, mitochondrial-like [Cucurbita maxima]|uniref:Pentatricopeptide repeat-containing protein At4g21705, mitochondrial-like n=1 Tax=Cucurbita maxima TaxID=3661 RepID=A0A6J1JQ72_CUCMA|nr:pentatricopeptide repeat-containing protein At4g21705, mitochondrial-like [Cucurbita maxima]
MLETWSEKYIKDKLFILFQTLKVALKTVETRFFFLKLEVSGGPALAAALAMFKILRSFSSGFTRTARTETDAFCFVALRLYSARRTCNRRNLFARISPLGSPELSVVPILDQWIQEGRMIKDFELRRIVRDLRNCRRYGQALEVSEWMRSKGLFSFTTRDFAVQLDLIGRVQGLDSAEKYFSSVSNQEEMGKLYGALLNCYVREGLVDKALSHMQKMKEMGFASSPLCYNDIMCLYLNTGQVDKVPNVLSEMKENGVLPDNYSYRICISSYGARSDLIGMLKVLKEMESQTHISMDWTTYSMVANFFIKAGMHEKAMSYLRKCEDKVNQDALGFNHLISLYTSLGCKDEVMRLWALQKKCKKQVNRDYITMLGCLVKLEFLEEAEKLVKEWVSSCECYDFRVPNVLLIGYSKRGLIERAEKMLQNIISDGRIPPPNSWGIIAAGYLEKQNLEKAFKCMKEAVAVQEQNKGWRPKPSVLSSILRWLSENGRYEELKEFLSSLKTVPSMDGKLSNAFDELLETLKNNDETTADALKESQPCLAQLD